MSVIKEKRGVTPDSVKAGGIFEINMDSYGKAYGIEVCRVIVKQLSGSAGNFSFSIGDTSNFASGSIHEKYLSAATASTGILDETAIAGFMMTGDTGRIYCNVTPDAGADNVYVYSIMYKH